MVCSPSELYSKIFQDDKKYIEREKNDIPAGLLNSEYNYSERLNWFLKDYLGGKTSDI